MRMRIRSPTYCRDKEKRQAQKTLPTKTEKGEAKIAVRQADKKRLVFLLGLVGKQKNNKNSESAILVTGLCMAFFNSAVGVLQTLVVALGAGLGIWGAINLLEGYGNDNPGANAHVR